MMDFDFGKASLPTMSWEEFRATYTCRLLTSHLEDCALLCNLSDGNLQEMASASNLRRGFYTMYGQEDFPQIMVMSHWS